MGLSDAHKGYEYQDLLTAYFIISDLLNDNYSEYKIDIKEFEGDKFDDLTIINNQVIKRQIKYSEDKTVTKEDFSSKNYDLALDVLYTSWGKMNFDKKVTMKILLAWDYDGLDFLEEIGQSEDFDPLKVRQFRINIDKIWDVNKLKPNQSWRRLRNHIKDVSRNDFNTFLENLTIELCLPKASLDIIEKGELEKITVERLIKFGVGTYPNHSKSPDDILLKLMNIVKNARANQKILKTEQIISSLGLIVGYGNIEQLFPIDFSANIYDENTLHDFYEHIYKNSKTVLFGEPGSGKSWFITNFINFLKSKNILFARHYCYTKLDDIFYTDRVTSDIFMANLINDIMLACPQMKNRKKSKFGVNELELQSLFDSIEEDIILIVDGLDHIERIKSSHENVIGSNKSDILEIIKRVKLPKNIKMVIVSQPIPEVLELSEKNFVITEMKKWDINEVSAYLKIRNVKVFGEKLPQALDEYIFNKSSGNPLYVTYLVNEIIKENPSNGWESFLDSIPDYNDDLKNYYDYLLGLIEEDHKVVYVLSGASFYLSIEELKSITGLGMYVKKRINALRSILKESVTNGGFAIYHESFRRYILELLESNELSIYDSIYKDLILWLEKLDVYKNIKAFNNLFRLLYESKQYNSLLDYASLEFVSECLFSGYGLEAIKRNLDFVVKAASKIKSFEHLLILSELSNILSSLKYVLDTYEDKYLSCIGNIHGFQWLSELLIYEEKMNMSLMTGLKICYLCSRNLVTPPWGMYIDELYKYNESSNEFEKDEIESLKYIIAASIDMDKNQEEIIRAITDSKNATFKKIMLEEYTHKDKFAELVSYLSEQKLMDQWLKTIYGIEEVKLDSAYIGNIFYTLKTVDSIYKDDAENKAKYLVLNASKIMCEFPNETEKFIKEIEDLSWFHNWIFFILKTSVFDEQYKGNGKELIKLYAKLISVTEVAQQGIRTVDLFGLRNEIYSTIQKPLKNLSLCKADWEVILSIIVKSSNDTMATLQNAMMGPLTTDKMFELVTEISNNDNYEIILNYFGEVIKEQETRRVHTDLANYYMQKSIFLNKIKRQSQEITEFKNSIRMIMSYGNHKDMTLSRLMNGVDEIYNIDGEKGREFIMRLESLAKAVVNQTDGRGTSDYYNEWALLLCRYEPEMALKKLIIDSEVYKCSWINESMLETLLINWSNFESPYIINALFKTLPNSNGTNFIKEYLNNIYVLSNKKEILLSRNSIFDLLSKFNFEDNMYGVDESIIKPLDCLCSNYNISCKLKKIDKYEKDPSESACIFEKNSSNHNENFEEKDINQVLEHIKTFGYSKELEIIINTYFLNQKNLSIEVKNFIRNLESFAFDNAVSRTYTKTQEMIIKLGDNNKIVPTIRAYLNLGIYLTKKDGWYKAYLGYEFFEKAYNLDKELAINGYFEHFLCIPKAFESIDGISDTIIKMLSITNDYQEQVIELCCLLYSIIEFRLSCREGIDWNRIKEEFYEYTNEELLYSTLLARLRYGVKGIHDSIFSSLEILLKQREERIIFVKPFKRILKNYNKYVNLDIVMLIQLVNAIYSSSEKEEFGLLELNNYLCINEDENVGFLLKYLLNIKMEYYNEKKDLVYKQDGNDYIVSQFEVIDKRCIWLKSRGISIDKYILDFFYGTLNGDYLKALGEIYFDKESSLLMDNIQIHSDFLQSLGNAVIDTLHNKPFQFKFLSQLRRFRAEEYFYDLLREDIFLLNAINNSTIIRPTDIPLPSKVKNSNSSVIEANWIRLAYIEREYSYKKDMFRSNNIGDNCKIYQVCSSIGFGDENGELPLYTGSYKSTVLNQIYSKDKFKSNRLKGSKTIVYTDAVLGYNPFLTYYRYDYLALTYDILNLLKISMLSTDDGLIGCNLNGDCVIKYQNWCIYKNLIGEEERTPVLRGSQLLVTKDFFDTLVNEIGDKYFCNTKCNLIFGE